MDIGYLPVAKARLLPKEVISLLWIMATIRVGASYGGSHRMRAGGNLQTSGLAYMTLLVMHVAYLLGHA
jgi:hypothetical protein